MKFYNKLVEFMEHWSIGENTFKLEAEEKISSRSANPLNLTDNFISNAFYDLLCLQAGFKTLNSLFGVTIPSTIRARFKKYEK